MLLDQKVEYEDELVEIIDEEKIIQNLWDRIKNLQQVKNPQLN